MSNFGLNAFETPPHITCLRQRFNARAAILVTRTPFGRATQDPNFKVHRIRIGLYQPLGNPVHKHQS